MEVLGISVGFPAAGRGPVVTCVVLRGSQGEPQIQEACELRTAALEVIDQVEDLGRMLSSKLSALNPNAVVICVADVSPAGNRKAAPRHRLMIEGALGYVCRDHKIQQVVYRNGKEVGEALGLSKAEALARGKALDSRRSAAAAAALTALPAASTTDPNLS
ncbi:MULTISPECIES: hypothetical protein [unclassified Streptomyces]|uniref:hypothetical protein n=1 Tax=unclassified Streptomyces TaxID=2593676 RepID=UPI00159F0707|nr:MULTISPECIES: hypothetical protein [unclassified Streptomyces]